MEIGVSLIGVSGIWEYNIGFELNQTGVMCIQKRKNRAKVNQISTDSVKQ